MSAAEKLDATFGALADPTRRKVIELLRARPQRAGELAASVQMVPPAMSRHLRVLRTSGLVEEGGLPEDARVRVYRLRAEPFSALRTWLDEVEAFWTDQLGAFKAHAEAACEARAEREAPRGRARAGRARAGIESRDADVAHGRGRKRARARTRRGARARRGGKR